jgi:hypothetical protein
MHTKSDSITAISPERTNPWAPAHHATVEWSGGSCPGVEKPTYSHFDSGGCEAGKENRRKIEEN